MNRQPLVRAGRCGSAGALALGVASLLSTVPAAALELNAASSAGTALPSRGPRQAVAINPVFIPFGTLSAEYEFALTPITSLGLSAWYEYQDVRARWAYLKALVYPWGVALRGLGVGVTFGMLRAYADPEDANELSRDTAPTIGAMAQYNYLFGPGDAFLLGAGIGGRTPLTGVRANSPIERLDGDVRIVAGAAF